MDDASILICYDNSDGSRRAVDAAAELFAGYHAVVLNIAPLLTGPESVAELSALAANFDQVNEDEGLAVAREGAAPGRAAGLTAECVRDSHRFARADRTAGALRRQRLQRSRRARGSSGADCSSAPFLVPWLRGRRPDVVTRLRARTGGRDSPA
jgi:hypothetical protein